MTWIYFDPSENNNLNKEIRIGSSYVWVLNSLIIEGKFKKIP